MTSVTPGTHQVTVNLTNAGNVTRAYTSPDSATTGWSSADGWALTTPANGTVTPSADGLLVVCNAGTVWLSKTVATVAGKIRRVRARVRLQDPEGRPTQCRITDNQTMTDTTNRLVSGVPVWIEGSHVTDVTTQVWIRIERPAGAASTAVMVEAVTFDTEDIGSGEWILERTDRNGTAVVCSGYPTGLDVYGDGRLVQFGSRRGSAGGALAFVDREVALTGNVDYRYWDKTGALQGTWSTGPTATGYGVLHRVTDANSTMHQVVVVDYRGGRVAAAQPIQVLGAALPNIPTAPLQATAGTLVCYFDSLDAARVVEADLATGEVFLLRQAGALQTSMDCYLVAQSLDIAIAAETEDMATPKWALTVGYLQVARPLTP